MILLLSLVLVEFFIVLIGISCVVHWDIANFREMVLLEVLLLALLSRKTLKMQTRIFPLA